jgi:hypothetical protein
MMMMMIITKIIPCYNNTSAKVMEIYQKSVGFNHQSQTEQIWPIDRVSLLPWKEPPVLIG